MLAKSPRSPGKPSEAKALVKGHGLLVLGIDNDREYGQRTACPQYASHSISQQEDSQFRGLAHASPGRAYR